MLRLSVFCALVGVLMVSTVVCVPGVELPTPPVERTALTVEASTSASDAEVHAGQWVSLTTRVPDVDSNTPMTYGWVQMSGTGVSLLNAETAEATLVAPSLEVDETLMFAVTVSSGDGGVGRAEVSVTVMADPSDGGTSDTGNEIPLPVARAGDDISVTEAEEGVLDGSASSGLGLTYLWEQVDGDSVQISDTDRAQARILAPAFTPGGVNQYEFELTVTDTRGRESIDSVLVTVIAVVEDSDEPVARAGDDQDVAGGAAVTLNGQRSTGDSLFYAWEQVAGTDVQLEGANTAVATFTAPEYSEQEGNTFEFRLTVTDAEQRTATDDTMVTVLADEEPDGPPRVKITTTLGEIVVELNEEEAPITVANFLQYVDEGFFANTIFHRVIPGFMIQGGGFEAGLVERETHEPIILETTAALPNERGTIAMARTNDPNSATSQFFINLVDNDFLNPVPGTPGYAVFGVVIEGMAVVDAIADEPTHSISGHENVPVTDVVILSITRVED